jgi:hypothetical protein
MNAVRRDRLMSAIGDGSRAFGLEERFGCIVVDGVDGREKSQIIKNQTMAAIGCCSDAAGWSWRHWCD